MTVPTSQKLRDVAGMVDRIGNFGSFPPTKAYGDNFGGQGILLNLQDPAIGQANLAADQVAGVRSHGLWCGVWHPVTPSGDPGANRAQLIHAKIAAIDSVLVSRGQPKIDVVWLNLEGYTIAQWKAFLWGVPGIQGWRGVNGVTGSTGGFRSGIATGIVDEPFKDGSVKPHADFMAARVMLAVEAFYGPTGGAPDMTPADHVQAVKDRMVGFRSDGTVHGDEAYPAAQVVGCYDAALGAVVTPHQWLRIRSGLHFTLERAAQHGLLGTGVQVMGPLVPWPETV